MSNFVCGATTVQGLVATTVLTEANGSTLTVEVEPSADNKRHPLPSPFIQGATYDVEVTPGSGPSSWRIAEFIQGDGMVVPQQPEIVKFTPTTAARYPNITAQGNPYLDFDVSALGSDVLITFKQVG